MASSGLEPVKSSYGSDLLSWFLIVKLNMQFFIAVYLIQLKIQT